MARPQATLDEILATFSGHLARSYPTPEDFRCNFDILLFGKRDRTDAEGYRLSLEKNVVYLSVLLDEALDLAERMLDPDSPSDEKALPGIIQGIEKKARGATAARHKRAFVEGSDPAFDELHAGREAKGYLEKLEFNYRYLMTLRVFFVEFVSVLAAVRSGYDLAPPPPDARRRVRNQIEIMAHYYLGNVTVKEPGA